MVSDRFKESEHLLYTQGVTGSSLVSPTILPFNIRQLRQREIFLAVARSVCKQFVSRILNDGESIELFLVIRYSL